MGWTIGVLGFGSQWGLGIFLFITTFRMALGPTQPSIQWVPRDLSLGHEADHPPPSSAKVKEFVELDFQSPQFAFMAWCSVKKNTGTT
jgi:hypothetical protein